MKRFVETSLGLLAVDLALITVSGGFSVFGPVGTTGFLYRIVASLLLLAWRYRLSGLSRLPGSLANARWCAYLAILLVGLSLVHLRGYRLRGDAMWYYAYARSLAFDRDLDFSNEYRRLGVDHFRGSQPVRETGLPRNTFPIGAGLLWIPFLVLGHVGTGLRNVYGQPTAYDGFSDPYLHAVALGGLLIGWLGLLVLDRLLRRWFSPGVSFAASVGTGARKLFVLVHRVPTDLHPCTQLSTGDGDHRALGERTEKHEGLHRAWSAARRRGVRQMAKRHLRVSSFVVYRRDLARTATLGRAQLGCLGRHVSHRLGPTTSRVENDLRPVLRRCPCRLGFHAVVAAICH